MKNVLVTGGAGFIGTRLCAKLKDLDFNITVIDNLSPQIHGSDYVPPSDLCDRFVCADICDKPVLLDILQEVDIIFHLAAETGTGQSMYEIGKYSLTNEYGTALLLESIAEIASNKKIDLVLSSSRSVYGEGLYLNAKGRICSPETREIADLRSGNFDFVDSLGINLTPVATTEDAPIRPLSVYAATKYSQEMLCEIFARSHSNVRLSILRLQNVYGEGQSLQNPYTGLISIFYNRLRSGKELNVFEDGLESRDFVHIDDIVTALVNSIARSDEEDLVCNIGSGHATNILELIKLLEDVTEREIRYQVSGDFRAGDIRHNFADLSVAKSRLNYEPSVSLRDGLQRFVAWASACPNYLDRSDDALSELKERGL